MPKFEEHELTFLPLLGNDDTVQPVLIGSIHHLDALKAYSRALAATAAEEHS